MSDLYVVNEGMKAVYSREDNLEAISSNYKKLEAALAERAGES
jgi:hypothetical protein